MVRISKILASYTRGVILHFSGINKILMIFCLSTLLHQNTTLNDFEISGLGLIYIFTIERKLIVILTKKSPTEFFYSESPKCMLKFWYLHKLW